MPGDIMRRVEKVQTGVFGRLFKNREETVGREEQRNQPQSEGEPAISDVNVTRVGKPKSTAGGQVDYRKPVNGDSLQSSVEGMGTRKASGRCGRRETDSKRGGYQKPVRKEIDRGTIRGANF